MNKKIIDEPIMRKISDYSINTFSDRVYRSNTIENKTREQLALKKSISYKHYSPDIIDFEKEIIGEIKTFSKKSRLFLSINQFVKYLELKNVLNTHRTIDGVYLNMKLIYYFVNYDQTEILKIYPLPSKAIEELFNTHELITDSSWYYEQDYINFDIRDIIYLSEIYAV